MRRTAVSRPADTWLTGWGAARTVVVAEQILTHQEIVLGGEKTVWIRKDQVLAWLDRTCAENALEGNDDIARFVAELAKALRGTTPVDNGKERT